MKIVSMYISIIYEECLADIKDIHRVKQYQGYLYLVPNIRRQEVKEEIEKRGDKIGEIIKREKSKA